MFRNHTHCRACGYAAPSGPPGIKSAPIGEKLVEVFDLGLQPPANNFVAADEEHQGFAPLKVVMCPKCLLAQLSVVVNPESLYSKYSYVTSTSDTMRGHFLALLESIKTWQPVHNNVLEIGSNDGTFLDFLKKHGIESVLGIDPAENLVAIAREKGVQSICGLFNKETARMASNAMPNVDVVIARHVFCHIDDWRGFVAALDVICGKNTLVIIEVPYVMDLLRQGQWDTIYHEHLSYLNIQAMEALLSHTPFRMEHIQHFPVHGGAIAIFIRRRDFEALSDDSVEWYLNQERNELNAFAWAAFDSKSNESIENLSDTVRNLVRDGKTLCGFGASAKSTVWVNACGFSRKELRFIADSTPQKQWKLIPGSDIPITDEGALLREMSDYAVMFCWNFRREALSKNESYLRQGGKFIIPVPTLEIVGQ